MYKLLIISPSSSMLNRLKQLISDSQQGIEIDEYDPKKGMTNLYQSCQKYNIILLEYDLGLEYEDGLHWLEILQTYPDIPPIVIITDTLDININAKALKLGASSCIANADLNAINIISTIKQAITLSKNQAPSHEANDILNITASDHTHDSLTNNADKLITKTDINLVVPGYELTEKIAKGGMATIFKAKRLEDGLNVVLKVMFTPENVDPIELKRFMQEYNLISTINHPHIIHIYERGFATNFSYIALEYLPSGNLGKRIAKKIPPDLAMLYLRQIALGLSAIHERNVIHRDLKPANILLKDEHTLKITDFGTAKIMDKDDEDMTAIGTTFGTPYYMSPEQCMGGAIDKRSDIYSLGIILYMMLTHRRPFKVKNIQEIMQAHIQNIIPELPDAHKKYRPLLNGLLAKEPDERFQSADDLVAGIDSIA